VQRAGEEGVGALGFDGIKVVLAQAQQAEVALKMSLLAMPARTAKAGSTRALRLMRFRYLPMSAKPAWLLKS